MVILLTASPSFAQTWDYTITDVDTPTTIDAAATTADVDTVNNEITLPPLSAPDIIRFWGSGEMDYVVLTTTGIKHYSFDGANMVENTILSVPGLTNPLALAAPDSFPDVVMADATGITHYSFTGSEMVQNPALSVSGLTGVNIGRSCRYRSGCGTYRRRYPALQFKRRLNDKKQCVGTD
jgi:hypothetical protein